jgi:hypothetical protein
MGYDYKTSYFSTFAKSKNFANLKELFESVPIIDVLTMAKEGDRKAVDYLWLSAFKLLTKAFHKYFIGPNKKVLSSRVDMGEEGDYVHETYAMLLGQSNFVANPLNSFNPAKYSYGTLHKHLNYYIYRYAQSLAFTMIKHSKNLGIVGGRDRYNKKFSSQDIGDIEQNTPNQIPTYTVTDKLGDEENKKIFKAFISHISVRYPLGYKIAMLRLKGETPDKIGTSLSLSRYKIVQSMEKLKDLYTNFRD